MEAFAGYGAFEMRLLSLRDYETIAVCQTAFLGDAALALPLAQAIKNLAPDSKIAFISTPAARNFVKFADAVDVALGFDKRGEDSGFDGIKSFAGKLRKIGVDCFIAPHRSLRTAALSAMSGARTTVGFDVASVSFLFKKRAEYKFHLHEVRRNLELLTPFVEFAGPREIPRPEMSIPEEIQFKVNELFIENGVDHNSLPIAIAPGSVWPTKRWPAENFAELAAKFIARGEQVVLIGSEGEKELCGFISKESGAINIAGKTTLGELIELLRHCKVLVTNDSSPTHFAYLAGTPTIAIFGPTSSFFGFAPFGENSTVIEKELRCKPCEIHGGVRCPIGTHECMTSIKPDAVWERIERIFETLD